jgi:hypothetical protein
LIHSWNVFTAGDQISPLNDVAPEVITHAVSDYLDEFRKLHDALKKGKIRSTLTDDERFAMVQKQLDEEAPSPDEPEEDKSP